MDASEKTPDLRRRDALAKLGLTAVIAYSAPPILHLDREAYAVQASCTGKGGKGGKGKSWCK